MPTLVLLALLLGGGVAVRGDATLAARVQRLGNQLICTCGCTQGALVCNHLGCPVVTQMQAEIRQRAQSSDADALVLQAFVQEYGTQVLANPTHEGFNRVAWVMPWLALGLGLLSVLWFVRRWRQRPVPAGGGVDPGLRDYVHAEISAQIAAEDADRDNEGMG
ncbi:MAG: cytochrome c-type biogenesis protein [Terriglobales bacterium]